MIMCGIWWINQFHWMCSKTMIDARNGKSDLWNLLFSLIVLFCTLFLFCCISTAYESWSIPMGFYFQILHTAGQIDIICFWLMQLTPRKEENKHVSYHIITSKIIQKHQKIINFSENIESLYTYIALLQFVSNTIMICSIAFVIVTVSKIVEYKINIILQVIIWIIYDIIKYVYVYEFVIFIALDSSKFYIFIYIFRSLSHILFITCHMYTVSKNFIRFVFNYFSAWYSQAIGSPNASEQILKSLLFYIITNLEAFIFCFAGEYLSSKVSYKIFTTMI